MEQVCKNPECTFSQTGQCVLNNDPETCQERLESLIADVGNILLNNDAESTILPSPEENERLTPSFTLSYSASENLMRSRYCKIVGILGVPGTGKTASLISLYLLLSHGKLKNFDFRDSKSVMAFEEISRGARKWNSSDLPEELTVHTELNDERSAGFLHLKLQNIESKKNIDLLLTDLPGEWTNTLINSNRTDRMNFLKSADRIWLTVNSEELNNVETRKVTLHRLELLVSRLQAFLSEEIPKVVFVVTHADKTDNSVVKYLHSITSLLKDKCSIIEIASFSSNNGIAPGKGIDELIIELMGENSSISDGLWQSENQIESDRYFAHYKNR